MADSLEPSNPFVGRWTYADSTEPEKWRELTHVDIWSVAQVVQRKGVDAEFTLLEMAKERQCQTGLASEHGETSCAQCGLLECSGESA